MYDSGRITYGMDICFFCWFILAKMLPTGVLWHIRFFVFRQMNGCHGYMLFVGREIFISKVRGICITLPESTSEQIRWSFFLLRPSGNVSMAHSRLVASVINVGAQTTSPSLLIR